ncbi:MAG: hypothetical protein ABFD89_17580 [Bryobacteraceae bacterium]
MAGYVPIFRSMMQSTVWGSPPPTRCVWFALMFLADKNGIVEASVPGLAREAVVSLDECVAALEEFQAPDPHSRTKDNEGRRLEAIDGGWRVLNYVKYRDKLMEMKAAEQNRRRVEKCRAAAVKRGQSEPPPCIPPEEEKRQEERSNTNTNTNTISANGLVMVGNGSAVVIQDPESADVGSGEAFALTGGPEPANKPKSKPQPAKRAANHEPAHVLSEGWTPTEKCLAALCSKYECEPAVILAHLPDFKLYWIHEAGAGTLKRPCDWSSTFRNRIDAIAGRGRLHIPKTANRNSKGKYGPPQPTDTSDDGWLASTMREQRN